MIVIQGRLRMSKTWGSPRTQLPECVHFEASQWTVISPFEYARCSSLMTLEYAIVSSGIFVGPAGVAEW